MKAQSFISPEIAETTLTYGGEQFRLMMTRDAVTLARFDSDSMGYVEVYRAVMNDAD